MILKLCFGTKKETVSDKVIFKNQNIGLDTVGFALDLQTFSCY